MNCQKCGAPLPANARVCEDCGAPVTRQTELPAGKRENVLTGTVGALIGAALGGGSIILLSQVGYVASLSGLILAICTLKGYELLGGTLSKKGVLISILLMLVTPYIADRLDWAIVIIQSFPEENITLGEAFAAVHAVIESADMVGDYMKNLLMIYGFAILGAFGTLRGLGKK